MPLNDYYEYFGPDYLLHLPVSNMENLNSLRYLEDTRNQVNDAYSYDDDDGDDNGDVRCSRSCHT